MPVGGVVIRLAITLTAFALAAGINTASVAYEHRSQWLTRRFGDRGWEVHLLVIAPGWTLFLWALARLGKPLGWPLPDTVWVLGPPIALAGVALTIAGFLRLGIVAALNGATFERARRRATRRGVFAWVAHPIYDGFALAFAGTGLWSTNAALLVLAVASYLLLNCCEARVENRAIESGGR